MCSHSLPLSETVFPHIPNRHNDISDDDSVSGDIVKMNSVCKCDVYMLSQKPFNYHPAVSDCRLFPLVPGISIAVLNLDSRLC